ncbi:low affinity immunoglobulin gamma Fc region receptor II-like [Anoplopoma fimbria]|uniref:low affinity immunoglobulin gamma Fc region receptor II-like n=1 Tax=Anoplopoma fimbria TaxID=229290 RepID=UPI0023ECC93C|nr:low affinity immunoglobulin gamma Fc region receptor II-like [Anoplopoma fimbria]
MQPLSQSSMEITTLCTIVASLRLTPNRSQYFLYESVTLSCGESGNSSLWRIKRNTSTHINNECSVNWGTRKESQCLIDDLLPLDTGVYWCEFGPGECSDAANITVTAGSVILESPVFPVQEGESVTLHCIKMTTSSSNLTAEFYKDGVLIHSSSTGNMTIHRVLKSDEGLYKCTIFGAGESRNSWLAVREAGRPESSHCSPSHILLPVVGVCLFLAACVTLLCLWRNYKGKTDADVLYTNVTITQEVQPKEDRGFDSSSTYSTIKP